MSNLDTAMELLEQYEAIVSEEILPNTCRMFPGGFFIKDFPRVAETLKGHLELNKVMRESPTPPHAVIFDVIKLLEQYKEIVTEDLLPNDGRISIDNVFIGSLLIKNFKRVTETLMSHSEFRQHFLECVSLQEAAGGDL